MHVSMMHPSMMQVSMMQISMMCVSMMNVYMMHVSLMYVSMEHESMMCVSMMLLSVMCFSTCNAYMANPTPRIALSVGWFVGSLVRSLVTKKPRIIDTRIKVTDHRYMHLSYPHHTHMHRDQGSYI